MVSTLSRLSEPSTACLMCSGRLFRPGAPFIPRGSKSGLRSNPNLVAITTWLAEGSESFAHEFFVHERAVHFGGVEECDAAFHGGPEKSGHLLLVFGRTVGKAHSHAAEPDSRNFQVAISQVALLHSSLLCPFRTELSIEANARFLTLRRVRERLDTGWIATRQETFPPTGERPG